MKNCPEHLKQGFGGEGLGDKAPAPEAEGLGLGAFHFQAAETDDLDFRIDGLKRGDGGRAIHDRHGHVGDDRGDFILAGGVNLDGVGAVGGQQDAVAEIVPACVCAISRMGSSSSTTSTSSSWPRGSWDCSCRRIFRGRRAGAGGKINLEDGALARLAVAGDEAAVALDDGQGGGQAQPGALAQLLGGEERLENPLLDFPGHSRPGVLHADDDIGPGLASRFAAA